jgi:hypothetical protein
MYEDFLCGKAAMPDVAVKGNLCVLYLTVTCLLMVLER